jgi:hypothetical protein
VEVVRHIVQLQLETVAVVLLDELPNQRQPLRPDFRDGPVEATARLGWVAGRQGARLRRDCVVCGVQLVPGRAADTGIGTLLDQQAGVQLEAVAVGAVDDDAQGVVDVVDEVLRVLVGPAED